MYKVYDPMTIAKWLLSWAALEEEEAPVSNLKLQKLLYYAQGHFMAQNNGRRLFDARIEAWAHGPVVPTVYHQFKHFGKGPIPDDPSFDFGEVDQEAGNLLASVWSSFGSRTAWKLREMTHSESPWLSTYNEYSRGNVIDDAKMMQYFGGLYSNVHPV